MIGVGIAAALTAVIFATVTSPGGDADGYARRRAVALAVALAALVMVASALTRAIRPGE